jgi:hypothetical protein
MSPGFASAIPTRMPGLAGAAGGHADEAAPVGSGLAASSDASRGPPGDPARSHHLLHLQVIVVAVARLAIGWSRKRSPWRGDPWPPRPPAGRSRPGPGGLMNPSLRRKPPGPGDGVAQRHRPVMLDQQERGRRVVGMSSRTSQACSCVHLAWRRRRWLANDVGSISRLACRHRGQRACCSLSVQGRWVWQISSSVGCLSWTSAERLGCAFSSPAARAMWC